MKQGPIHKHRYDNYVELYKEIRKSNEENRYS
jgi:putative ribosome biogenesis GTPase RsgA